MDLKDKKPADANRDPITGAPGAHPVGVGAGAATGGAAGAAIGTAVGGPVGAVVGAVAGAVGGGLAGKAAGEAINPTAEHAYWRGEYEKRPYFTKGTSYDNYGPAYQYGWESYGKHGTRVKTFDEVEAELARDWNNRRGTSTLTWDQARDATRDAWGRVASRPRTY